LEKIREKGNIVSLCFRLVSQDSKFRANQPYHHHDVWSRLRSNCATSVRLGNLMLQSRFQHLSRGHPCWENLRCSQMLIAA